MGGEKSISAPSWGPGTGSPPRGRGKGPHLEKTAVRGGITPAWAGKRSVSIFSAICDKDHPRVGGEKEIGTVLLDGLTGSPPRGRGKVFAHQRVHLYLGITPAWAGKSFSMTARGRVRKDHPRVGGEKSVCGHRGRTPLGSPPRGRGKDLFPFFRLFVTRITPAWAGKRPRRGSALT